MADIKRLIGTDGSIAKIDVTATTVSTGAALAARSWYKVTNAGTVAWGGLALGDYYFNPNNATLNVGGTGVVLTLCYITPVLDVAGWSLDLTADETETTVLGDIFKKYRQGRSDASGQLEMVFMKGETDLAQVDSVTGGALGAANAFFNEVTIADAGQTVSAQGRDTSAITLLGYLDQDNSSGGVTMATIMTIQLMSFSLDFKKSDVVMVSPKFRLTGSLNPSMYRIIA